MAGAGGAAGAAPDILFDSASDVELMLPAAAVIFDSRSDILFLSLLIQTDSSIFNATL